MLTGRKISITEEIRDFIDRRLDNATKVFKIDPMEIEVVLRRDQRSKRDMCTCEITLRTKGHIIRTEATDEDVRAAIEIAATKLERQLRKFKTKVVDRRQRAPRLNEAIELVASEPTVEDEREQYFDDGEDEQLVRIKEVEMSVLNTREALLQMDLLGHDFYLYVAAEDGLPTVLYRRDDGGYGMLHPRKEQEEG
jgi:putative sigma-54 modulation protein